MSDLPGGLLKGPVSGPHTQNFRFSRWRWGLRICISNKCPDDADTTCLRTTRESHFQAEYKGKWWKKNILIFCHPYQSNIFKESFKTSGGISASNGIIEGSLLIWLPFTTISNSCVSEVQSICCWTKKILSNLSLRQVYFGTVEKFRSSKNQSDSLLFQTHLAKPSCLGLVSISSPLIWPKWTVLMTWKLSNRVRRRKS